MTDPVDIDRLADYTAGLLDGTPDAVEVARLVRTDPEWARAHAQLRTADALVAADLAALGAEPVRIPPEVAARLTEALDGAGEAGDRTVVSLAARRRRRRRWAAVAAVAAGIVGFGAVGLPLLAPGTSDSGGEGAFTSARGGAADIPPAAAPAQSGLIVRATGRDYRRQATGKAPAEVPQQSTADDLGGQQANAVPAQLLRLYDPTSRQDCLSAVVRVYGGQPESVDYARFEGAPALIVILTDERRVPVRLVAVGPRCGLDGDPDVRHTEPIA